jgi:pimeloyl-ACP methyl ester carboxylesterase
MFERMHLAAVVLLFCGSATAANEEPSPVKNSFLKVPGAKLYYEAQGTGPLLLLIPGGPADAGVFAELSRHLAGRYTVVAYDPRGNSRSTLDAQPEEQRVEQHANDAARLIDDLGNGPAYVFGTSGGAQIGLDLIARHPQRVRFLVAHEPPCIMLLDDPGKSLANNQELYEIYRQQGAGSAMQRFMAMNGMSPPQQSVPGERSSVSARAAAETFGRIEKNLDYFFRHGVPIALYRPDLVALRANANHIVIAVGKESAGHTAHLTGVALAAQLRTQPVLFAGDHLGYGPHAAEFAETLHAAFDGK